MLYNYNNSNTFLASTLATYNRLKLTWSHLFRIYVLHISAVWLLVSGCLFAPALVTYYTLWVTPLFNTWLYHLSFMYLVVTSLIRVGCLRMSPGVWKRY